LEQLTYRAGDHDRQPLAHRLGHSAPSWATVRAIAGALEVSLVELAEAVEAER